MKYILVNEFFYIIEIPLVQNTPKSLFIYFARKEFRKLGRNQE